MPKNAEQTIHFTASKNDAGETQRPPFLVSRHDWVYLLSLLTPLFAYDLVLKGMLVAFRPETPVLGPALRVVQPDLFFNLGYLLLWIGLVVVAKQRLLRWIVFGLFHAVSITMALVMTGAYQYFMTIGSPLHFDDLRFLLSSPQGMAGLVTSGISPGVVVVIVAIVFYGLFGPRLAVRFVSQWRGWPHTDRAAQAGFRTHGLRAAGAVLAAFALFWLSMVPGSSSVGTSGAFGRDAFINVMRLATEVVVGQELPDVADGIIPRADARLLPTPTIERRNIALIVLESTRATATTPYNEELLTTPFMDELAKQSLVVEQAYAIIPHTHNALAAINCGIDPPLDPRRTRFLTVPGAVGMPCLPHMLEEQGYRTAYFMSQVKTFENTELIMKNLGYQDFFSVEDMDTEEFEPTNYFGYEDEIMLEPSRAWLKAHRNQPFLAAYLTSAPHHDYLAPSSRHGRVQFSTDDAFNRYLNSVRNQDFFLQALVDQYKQLGLYDNTIFIILGDHGQGFGEHGRWGHNNMIYEEGLRIPLLIHDPMRFHDGTRLHGAASQLDILPTIAELLGYKIQGGDYAGISLLQPVPPDRTLMFSCSGETGCIAGLKGTEKYIYHFDERPEELFDLATDPEERNNLAGQRSAEELSQRRLEILQWRAQVNATYDGRQASH